MRYPKVKLAADISAHPFTGWRADGHVLIEANTRESAIRAGAVFVRNNLSGVVMKIDNSRQHRFTPVYVNPCLACRSLEHKTYSRKCVVR